MCRTGSVTRQCYEYVSRTFNLPENFNGIQVTLSGVLPSFGARVCSTLVLKLWICDWFYFQVDVGETSFGLSEEEAVSETPLTHPKWAAKLIHSVFCSPVFDMNNSPNNIIIFMIL